MSEQTLAGDLKHRASVCSEMLAKLSNVSLSTGRTFILSVEYRASSSNISLKARGLRTGSHRYIFHFAAILLVFYGSFGAPSTPDTGDMWL